MVQSVLSYVQDSTPIDVCALVKVMKTLEKTLDEAVNLDQLFLVSSKLRPSS